MSRHRKKDEGSTLTHRLEALDNARRLAEGRLPETALAETLRVLERASARRSLSAEHTVVAFFGATGSGKSSLFNAVTGSEIAAVAARRPTTSEPLAAIWGSAGSEPLLDWLEVHHRHHLDDGGKSALDVDNVILVDLPDFDSTALEHRRIVERMAGQVDVLIWVLDPQKYADAAVHQNFLRPMASHGAVMFCVLNQVDTLPVADVDPVIESLHSILLQDGLSSVQVLPVSARTGVGVEELRAYIQRTADRRQAINARLSADVARSALELETASSTRATEVLSISASEKRRLGEELAQAAQVGVVVDAVAASYRHQAKKQTGWPVTRWLSRLKPDPLRRLNLGRSDVNSQVNRTSLPQMGASQRAQADTAVRTFAEAAAAGAPEPWRAAIRRAARASAPQLPDALDQAIASADLKASKKSWWWPLVGVVQWLALAAAAVGALWLGVLAILGYLQFAVPEPPRVEGFALPTLLLTGGILLGIVLAVASAFFARLGARLRASRARRRLKDAVAKVAETHIVTVVQMELTRYRDFLTAVAQAHRK